MRFGLPLLALLACIALMMIGPQIIVGLFRYGAFSMSDAQASGMALSIYAIASGAPAGENSPAVF